MSDSSSLTTVEKIKNLVSQNKLEATIPLLKQVGMADAAQALSGRIARLKEKSLQGVLKNDEKIVEENKIAAEILELCKGLDKNAKRLESEERTGLPNSKTIYFFAGIIIALFISTVFYFSQSISSPKEDSNRFFSKPSAYNILILPFSRRLGKEDRQFHYEIRDTLIHIARMESLPLEASVWTPFPEIGTQKKPDSWEMH